MSLSNIVNSKIHKVVRGIDKSQQLQSIIDPELNFGRNSINLYIGRRGSGKTFNVLRELIKLSHLPDQGGYNSFIYVTDKQNDSTVDELLQLVKLKTRVVSYANMLEFLNDYVDAKTAYAQVIKEGLQAKVTNECKADLFKSLDVTSWVDTPGTVILYDDAINIFKNSRYKQLLNNLFKNRQAQITYFLCMQDGFGLPVNVKRNLGCCIVFGGYNDTQMLVTLFRQLSSTENIKMLIGVYFRLTNREGLHFDYDNENGSVGIMVLREDGELQRIF
jgi:hypothetical protein